MIFSFCNANYINVISLIIYSQTLFNVGISFVLHCFAGCKRIEKKYFADDDRDIKNIP